MWHDACRTGMAHTAYGILLDMFHLWKLLESDPASPATEHQVAGFKEDLMHILDDSNSEQLRLWRHLWHDDRETSKNGRITGSNPALRIRRRSERETAEITVEEAMQLRKAARRRCTAFRRPQSVATTGCSSLPKKI